MSKTKPAVAQEASIEWGSAQIMKLVADITDEYEARLREMEESRCDRCKALDK